MRCRVASETARLPLSAYDTVLGDTPERRAISPMFIELLRGTGAVDRGPFGGEMRRGSVESFRAKWKYSQVKAAEATAGRRVRASAVAAGTPSVKPPSACFHGRLERPVRPSRADSGAHGSS